MVKNLPASAEDMGSIPGLGGPHMPQRNWAHEPQLLSLRTRAHKSQLLSPCATTTEATHPRARVPQLLSRCVATAEAHRPGAHAPQQENPQQ